MRMTHRLNRRILNMYAGIAFAKTQRTNTKFLILRRMDERAHVIDRRFGCSKPYWTLNDNMAADLNYYRRSLPSTCIDFVSAEGKQIFKEAINGKHMNCYFNLAAQFRTQDEPAYCGLTTLVMVLNALSVDPGRVWKAPWRWYHENMLDCCIPLSLAEKQGINLFQFLCLAKCNGLDVNMIQVTPSASVEEFRNYVKTITQCENEVLVCSYSRPILEQTGDGHFSPIGGYHAGRDLVLIFDVARFKYPPYWVEVEMLWQAMQGLDNDTGQPRGYFILKQTSHTGLSTVLFKVSEKFDLTLSSQRKLAMEYLTQQWWTWLGKTCETNYEKSEFFQVLVSKFIDLWCTKGIPDSEQLLRIDTKCCGELSEQHQHVICDLIDSLEKQPLFRVVENSLKSGEYEFTTISQMTEPLRCQKNKACLPGMKLAHFVSMVLFSWPYKTQRAQEVGDVTHALLASQYVHQEMSGAHQILQSEVELLWNQFATIFCYYSTTDNVKSP